MHNVIGRVPVYAGVTDGAWICFIIKIRTEMKKLVYKASPSVDVREVCIEKGFAVSSEESGLTIEDYEDGGSF